MSGKAEWGGWVEGDMQTQKQEDQQSQERRQAQPGDPIALLMGWGVLPLCRLACGPCQRSVGALPHGPWADGP